MVRNPYDWLNAMLNQQYYSPRHHQFQKRNDWKGFLLEPWTTKRPHSDWVFLQNATMTGGNGQRDLKHPCRQKYAFHDVIACSSSVIDGVGSRPFYEMRNDGSGLPYASIMELRSDKLRNLLSVKEYPGIAAHYIARYEELLANGTAGLIQQISKHTGIEAKCDSVPPQNRPVRPMSPQMEKYINRHLNWTVESWIGYHPRTRATGVGNTTRILPNKSPIVPQG